jgi:hypothetical protein
MFDYLNVIFLIKPFLIGLNELVIKQIAIFDSFYAIFSVKELDNTAIIIPDCSIILNY